MIRPIFFAVACISSGLAISPQIVGNSTRAPRSRLMRAVRKQVNSNRDAMGATVEKGPPPDPAEERFQTPEASLTQAAARTDRDNHVRVTDCQRGVPASSDLSAWVDMYDTLNGSSWKVCADRQVDPCSCGSFTPNWAHELKEPIWEHEEQNEPYVCCQHDETGLRIKAIVLRNNSLQGSLPSAICAFTGLQFAWLDNNYISGTLPPCIRNLAALEELQLSQNELHGPLPKNLGSHMPHLRRLALYENQVYKSSRGHHCKKLYRVRKDGHDDGAPRDWSCGGFSGDLFETLNGASALTDISVDSNSFHGSVPSWLCEAFPKLVRFDIFDNPISGTLPMSIEKCHNLCVFQVAATQINGPFPALCQLKVWDVEGMPIDFEHARILCGREYLKIARTLL